MCVGLSLQRVRDAQYRNYFNMEEEVAAAAPAIAAEALKVAPVSCFGAVS